MKVRNNSSKLTIIALIIAAMTASANSSAFAKTIKGSFSGTFVTANFSFDGAAEALSIIFTGQDNLSGPFTGQEIAEFHFTSGSCSAPDGTSGTPFTLADAAEAMIYKQGQLYAAGTTGSGCLSNTTGSLGVTETLSVTGGMGKFANASGSIDATLTGRLLPPAPIFGQFGAFQGTETGEVTD